MKRKLKPGSRVYYKGERRTVYDVYPNNQISLCLVGYPDSEGDWLVDIKEVS